MGGGREKTERVLRVRAVVSAPRVVLSSRNPRAPWAVSGLSYTTVLRPIKTKVRSHTPFEWVFHESLLCCPEDCRRRQRRRTERERVTKDDHFSESGGADVCNDAAGSLSDYKGCVKFRLCSVHNP